MKNAINGDAPTFGAQAARGRARLAARAGLDEGQDPDRLPEHDLLRERRLRRRAGLPRLLRPQRRHGPRQPCRGGAARRDPGEPDPLRPGRPPEDRPRAPQPRAAPDATRQHYLTRTSTASTATGRCRTRVGPAPGEPGAGGAVLRELRDRPARLEPEVRQEGLRRRLPRDDDDRPRAAEDRARRDREGAAAVDRADGRARHDRRAHGRRPRDGRRPQLPPEPVQPRDAGGAPARLVVQAVRARGGAQGGHLAGDGARLAPGDDRRGRTAVERRQLRGRGPRARST